MDADSDSLRLAARSTHLTRGPSSKFISLALRLGGACSSANSDWVTTATRIPSSLPAAGPSATSSAGASTDADESRMTGLAMEFTASIVAAADDAGKSGRSTGDALHWELVGPLGATRQPQA